MTAQLNSPVICWMTTVLYLTLAIRQTLRWGLCILTFSLSERLSWKVSILIWSWDFARWRRLSEVIRWEAKPGFSQADQKSALLLFKPVVVHQLIDFSLVEGLPCHFLMTSVTCKWNRVLWEKMSSLSRGQWSRCWSALDAVQELQMGNRLGLLRLSRGEGYMDTCFISVHPQMINHYMYTILDLRVHLSRLPARGRRPLYYKRKPCPLPIPDPGTQKPTGHQTKGQFLNLVSEKSSLMMIGELSTYLWLLVPVCLTQFCYGQNMGYKIGCFGSCPYVLNLEILRGVVGMMATRT